MTTIPYNKDAANPGGNDENDTRNKNTPLSWTAESLLQASYKDLGSPSAVQDCFLRHLLRHCRPSLRHLLRQDSSTTTKDYSITVDAFCFLRADPVLGHLLLRYPATLLPLLEDAVVQAQHVILQEQEQTDDTIKQFLVKGDKASGTRVHARLVHLPPAVDAATTSLSRVLQADLVGRMVQVTGVVVRTSAVQMYESRRTYTCTTCSQTLFVSADVEQRHNALRAPDVCTAADKSTGQRCGGNKFKVVPKESIHTDYQEIKLQETSHGTGSASIPRSLLVKVQHDLVDSCQPGDQVVVVGSLLAQWPAMSSNMLVPDAECPVDMAMMAHSVRVVDDERNNNGSTTLGSDLEHFQREFDVYWKETPQHGQYPIAARDFICQAVCPKLYGMAIIKLALLVTLIGGVSSDVYSNSQASPTSTQELDAQSHQNSLTSPAGSKRGLNDNQHLLDDAPESFVLPSSDGKSRSNNAVAAWNLTQTTAVEKFVASPRPQKSRRVYTRRRDQSHLLLVGDPGVGKSQFLKFAAALSPRSVLTTGVGTTSAGLTCAAVREGGSKGEFSLEAGALVLADKGVCCIDEFGCIQDQDRTTIHEAMEQQTLSVAKAGIVCKLNCRATIVAVMNPRDCIYDNQASLSANTGLGTPLLSRFDLIFKLVDAADAERDHNVTMYLLNRAIQGSGLDVGGNDFKECGATTGEPWSMDKLRAYIAVVKERFQPVMSDEAAMLLEAHYEKCRSAQSNTIPVTVRFLESLIRLSQAHARLMYRNQVTIQDAVAAIRLMECSAFAYGGFDGSNVFDQNDVLYCDPMTVDFSDEADVDFACWEHRVLGRYNMLHFMPSKRRTMAMQAMSYSHPQGSGWDGFEDPHERR